MVPTFFEDQGSFRKWLEDNHKNQTARVMTAKKEATRIKRLHQLIANSEKSYKL